LAVAFADSDGVGFGLLAPHRWVTEVRVFNGGDITVEEKLFKDDAVMSIQVEFSQRVPNGPGHVRSFNLIVTL
jgi:hypothetical protein